MVLLLALMIGVISTLGAEYLVKSPIPPTSFKKKISEDVYLVEKADLQILGLKRSGVLLEKNHKLKIFNVPLDPCLERWDLEFIRAYKAWDIFTGSEIVYVGLLDTGVDYNNPDLKVNLWKNTAECGGVPGIDDDGNGYVDDCFGVNVLCYPKGSYDPTATGCNSPDALDDNGHGTHVAGIIGAVGNNNFLTVGINWKVKIIPCKFLNSAGIGDIAGEIECLKYIRSLKERGLNVVAVNASYGAIYPASDIQKSEISKLADLDILYISAAGNWGFSNEENGVYPCNYDLENQICVGAINPEGDKAYFSNYGQQKVKLLAPGEEIASLKSGSYSNDCQQSLVKISGTSMATGFVTGGVALLKGYNSLLNYKDLKKTIIINTRKNLNLSEHTYSCGVFDLYSLFTNETESFLCLSRLTIDFGTVSSCTTLRESLVVRNTGSNSLVVREISVNGKGFFLKSDNCSGKTLDPLEECKLSVEFNPPKTGNYTGKIFFYTDKVVAEVNLKGKLDSSELIVCYSSSGCNNGIGYAFVVIPLLFLKRLLKIRLL